jgi:tripartite-type tricarboxylate transporter receptor subunit TctC
MKKSALWLTAFALCVGFASGTATAKFPEKPITVVVPYSAGGGVDVMTRFLATASQKYLGVPMIIENVPGGSGLIGASRVASAAPDGYTLVANTTGGYTVAPHIYPVSFDPLNSFIPLFKSDNNPMILLAGPAAPAKTFKEFIEWIKANPGQATVGCAGLGDISGIQLAYSFNKMGYKIRIVPFRGAAETTSNVLGGHVMYGNASDAAAMPHLESGKLIPFLEFGGNPGKFLKNIPTLDSLGYPGASIPYYKIISAPSGTPKETVDILREAFVKMAGDPDVRKLFDNAKMPHEAWSNDSEAINKVIKDDYEKFGIVVKELGIAKK